MPDVSIINGYNLKDKFARDQLGKFSFFVTPQMYGAIGNGEADDTQAVQAAINSGFPVFIPEGIYKCSDALHVNRDDISITGSGYGSILKFTSQTNGIELFSWKPVIRNLSLYGERTAKNGILYCRTVAASMGILENIYITSFTEYGINHGDIALYALKYQNVKVWNCENGIRFRCMDSFMSMIDVLKCNGYGIHVTTGASSCTFTTVKIAECAMVDRTKPGLFIESHRHSFNGLELQDCGGNGLYITGTHNQIDNLKLDCNSANTLYPAMDEGDHLYAGAVIFGFNNVVKGSAFNYRGNYQTIAYIAEPNNRNIIDIQCNGQGHYGESFSEETDHVQRKIEEIRNTLTTADGTASFNSTDGGLQLKNSQSITLPFKCYSFRFKVKSGGWSSLLSIGDKKLTLDRTKLYLFSGESVVIAEECMTTDYKDIYISISPYQSVSGIGFTLEIAFTENGEMKRLFRDVSNADVTICPEANEQIVIKELVISTHSYSILNKHTLADITINHHGFCNAIDSVNGHSFKYENGSVSPLYIW